MVEEGSGKGGEGGGWEEEEVEKPWPRLRKGHLSSKYRCYPALPCQDWPRTNGGLNSFHSIGREQLNCTGSCLVRAGAESPGTEVSPVPPRLPIGMCPIENNTSAPIPQHELITLPPSQFYLY